MAIALQSVCRYCMRLTERRQRSRRAPNALLVFLQRFGK